MVLQRSTEKPESDWIENKCWNPECVKTIFRLPFASVACTNREWESVADEVPVDQGNYDADPVNE